MELSMASAGLVVNNKVMGELEVSWTPPSKGWVKLNTNGATKSTTNQFGYGGLSRYMFGR